jgi:hypothetical protein
MAIGGLAALLGTASQAIFTDTASVGGNAFGTGTVDISTAPATAVVTLDPIAPGDSVGGNELTVTNAGTLALRYAVTSLTTEDVLAAELDLEIWAEAAEAVVDGACDSTAPASVLYGPADLGNTTAINVIGDPTQGSQAGDRTLAASGNELLCFKVAFPLSATNASQGLSTTATFDFQAEQTINNP